MPWYRWYKNLAGLSKYLLVHLSGVFPALLFIWLGRAHSCSFSLTFAYYFLIRDGRDADVRSHDHPSICMPMQPLLEYFHMPKAEARPQSGCCALCVFTAFFSLSQETNSTRTAEKFMFFRRVKINKNYENQLFWWMWKEQCIGKSVECGTRRKSFVCFA